MFSLYADLELTTWPLIALDWLSIANDQTEGLLDLVMAIGIVIPVLLGAWYYLSHSGSGSGGD